MWAVTATVTTTRGRWTTTRQVPAFYLNEDVQGITTAAQAVAVAERIIDVAGRRGVELRVCAVKV